MVTIAWCSASLHTRLSDLPSLPTRSSWRNNRLGSNQPSSEAPLVPSKAERTKRRFGQLIMACIFSLFAFYFIFNFLLLLFKSYVACAYISNWTLEITNFDPGPAVPWMDTSWLERPVVTNSRQVPDRYANFSFTLSIKSNPSWLKVHIRHIDLQYAIGQAISLSDSIIFSGDATLTVHRRFYLHCTNRIACQCLGHILSSHASVPFILTMEVEPAFFGQHVDLLQTRSFVSFGGLAKKVGLPPNVTNVCENLYTCALHSDNGTFNDRSLPTEVEQVWNPNGAGMATYVVLD
ncbi:hypothetical protein FOL47_004008 [Perkinsus chesapeaki]|uniref:Uncharacterized protein n=1 Tax=Perkinsus chesapeaki TaxID=330153 RepID=A0A7J6M4Z9_PERCH|nr:hypothetical protein FOL47_004008 [Perkinsus chesapeaki]